MRWAPSPNHDARPDGTPIDTLVLHYTGMQDAAGAIARLCDQAAAVSAHYVVEEDGTIWQLVDEQRRAFHAGVSFWRGARALNGRSIGVEIVNPGHQWGYRPFPAAQIEAVIALCRAIQCRHAIDRWNVVAHSDVAPDRKQDPGELFPWQLLAQSGIGLWPSVSVPARADLPALLEAIGYDTTLAGTVSAFQRHWRPELVHGFADQETADRAQAVLDLAHAT